MKNLKELCFCATLFFSMASTLSVVAAQENAQLDINKLFTLSLEELMEVDISVASKREETVFAAPSSVTVFTRQEIQAMGVTSLEELLNFAPGFVSFRESVFGDGYMVAARGRTTPQASYNILFMLNGQALIIIPATLTAHSESSAVSG